MGYNTGMLKYMIMAPMARPVNFFKYGGGFTAIWSAVSVLNNSQTDDPAILVDAYFAYLSTKYLPPTTVADVALPIIVGAVVAGLSWRAAVDTR
jgi:hypothetical protein